jgi:hypothetical protein
MPLSPKGDVSTLITLAVPLKILANLTVWTWRVNEYWALNNCLPPPKRQGDDPMLVECVRQELERLGCRVGGKGMAWTSPTKRSAREALARRTDLADDHPGPDLIARLSHIQEQVCTPICGPRQVAQDGRCVTRACSAGQIGRRGQCVPCTVHSQARPPRNESAGSRCFVFDGRSYCQ